MIQSPFVGIAPLYRKKASGVPMQAFQVGQHLFRSYINFRMNRLT